MSLDNIATEHLIGYGIIYILKKNVIWTFYCIIYFAKQKQTNIPKNKKNLNTSLTAIFFLLILSYLETIKLIHLKQFVSQLMNKPLGRTTLKRLIVFLSTPPPGASSLKWNGQRYCSSFWRWRRVNWTLTASSLGF